MPDTANITQNVFLGNTKEGKIQNRNKILILDLRLSAFLGPGPAFSRQCSFFLSRNYSSVEIFTENGMAVRLMQSSWRSSCYIVNQTNTVKGNLKV